MDGKGKHALVFGASGLIGWGVVDQLLSNYPTQGTFAKVTALVNRPLDVRDSFWPLDSPRRPDLQLVSGINLADVTVQSATELLQTKVKGIEDVTHAFYFVYKYEEKPEDEVQVVCGMLECAVGALNRLSPKLEFLVFPSGTKAYGIQIPGGVFQPPYKESMGPLPHAYQKTLNYPFMRAVLQEASAGRQWTWCDIRPDAVIGFVPNGSAFNLTAHWATYLSLYRLIEGPNAKVPFPGSLAGYNSLYNEASANIIARLAIWASLHTAEAGGGQIFNVADQAKPESMRERWPKLAAYFGLEGVSPSEGDQEGEMLKPSEYIKKHQREAEKLGVKSSPVFKGGFLDSYGFYLDFDRQLSLDKVREAGFGEELDPNVSWFKAFENFKEAGMIIGC
ncbi:MAG: hypothetical protein Q9172_005552 [Xanthocarpia lactea]